MNSDTLEILKNQDVNSWLFIETLREILDQDETKQKSVCKMAQAGIFNHLLEFFNRVTTVTPDDDPNASANFVPLLLIVVKMCSFVIDSCRGVSKRKDFCALLIAIRKSIRAAIQLNKINENVESEFLQLEEAHRISTARPRKNEPAAPIEHFLNISHIPTPQEINQSDLNPINPVLIQGPYDSVEHYVDVQFRLLREDFVAAVRDGVQAYRAASAETRSVKRRFESIRVYTGVYFERSKFSTTGTTAYVVNFDPKKNITANYETSQFFMHGSILFFSNNDFRTFFCARVHQHDPALLNTGRLYVTLEFHYDPLISDEVNVTYTMIEPNVYFEPYSLVLQILKKFDETNFPMRKFIVETSVKVVDPPSYLSKFNKWNLFSHHQVKPLDFDTWPTSAEELDLDNSQYEALKTALTRKFCIIQGPPGTGKTRLGLKIVETLLANMSHKFFIPRPILVICYTNHALDQFLEGILKLTREIIRVGGQSRSECLVDRYNLKTIRAMRKASVRREKEAFYKGVDMDEIPYYMEDDLYDMKHEIDIRDYFHGYRYWRSAKNKRYDAWKSRFPYASRIQEIGRLYYRSRELLCILDTLYENLQMLNKSTGILSIDCLQDVMISEHKKVLSSDFALVMWLLDENEVTFPALTDDDLHFFNNLKCDKNDTKKEIFGELFESDDEEEELYEDRFIQNKKETDLEYCISLNGLGSIVQYFKKKLDLVVDDKSIEYTWAKIHLTNLVHRYYILRDNLSKMSTIIWAKIIRRRRRKDDDLLKLPLEDRWNIYFTWIDTKKGLVEMKIRGLKHEYKKLMAEMEEYQLMEDVDILRSVDVVGMTTTGAARYNNVLLKVKPSVVIVEEAAEVLEAHIVANLSQHTEHLILIGDHKQLKPSIATHELSKTYNLDCSLFERMINNNMYCPLLKVQHRMRPEISSLVSPIYKKLQNHKDVEKYESVRGVLKDVFFVDHTNFESEVEDSTSFVNIHEADFVVELCLYIINQGYSEDDITLLTTYVGQKLLIEQRKTRRIANVRTCVVDEFQGEESNIIILSLVRSNPGGNIGFLKTENRVCVALSRAKIGFYLIGNMSILSRSSAIWRKIREKFLQMRGKGIGPQLTLRCEKHGTFTDVATAQEFSAVKGGGCHMKCDAVLPCGHDCTHSCHIADQDHEDEFSCRLVRSRKLECGHTVKLLCSMNESEYTCSEEVEFKSKTCKHKLKRKCSDSNTENIICENICRKKLRCGHECPKICHPDGEHTDYVCEAICGKRNKKCTKNHTCRRKCFEECGDCSEIIDVHLTCGHTTRLPCMETGSEVKCPETCEKICVDCSAPCKKKCWENCQPCKNEVQKVVEKCGHVVTVPCCDTPTLENCENSRTVDGKAVCGHDRIYGVPCRYSDNFDPEDYFMNCEEPCNTVLSCKHVCSGSCRDCLQGRQHVGCKQICGCDLNCGHKCADACNEICPPCRENSLLECSHQKVKRRCGAFYTICEEPCEWKCAHKKCSKVCGELCDRKPCEEDCPQKLAECGHLCSGFCGEPCPPCRVCSEAFPENNRYVLLKDCGCVIESRFLEDHLDSSEHHVAMYSCPKCGKYIFNTMRFMNRIKKKYEQIVEVNKRIHSLDSDLILTRDEVIKKLEKFPQHKDKDIQALLEIIEVQFRRAVYDIHDVIDKQDLASIKYFLDLVITICDRLNSVDASVIAQVDFRKGILLLSEVLKKVELGALLKNKHKIEGLHGEFIKIHRILDYCLLLHDTSSEDLKANERLEQICEGIRTLIYRREFYGLDKDREVDKLFDEFFSLERKKGRYSSDYPKFNDLKYIDLLLVQSNQSWRVCQDGHLYHAANVDCPKC